MRRAGARAAGAVALATDATTAVSAAGVSAAPASVVDGTFSCATTVTRGARTIEIDASSGLRKRTRLASLAQVIVSSGNDPSVPVSLWTPTGKPLAYAELLDSGRARVCTARDCF